MGQLVIEATRGDDTQGYAAIDGVFFDDSPLLPNCDTLPKDAAINPPTPTPPVIKDCNFESDYCGWHTESGENSEEKFIWDRTTGEQLDDISGPATNHDGKRNSRFMIIFMMISSTS